MHGQCLVAVYPSRNEADQAFRAARRSGIASHNIRMSGADMEGPHGWDWLFSRHVPERDRTYYRTHLAEGRTALSVLIDGGARPARIEAVEEILDRFHPVDVRIEEEEEEGSTAAAGRQAKKSSAQAAPKGEQAAPRGEEEEIIALPREKPKVGARAMDRIRHIRTYVVEEPFEQEVSLSDERLVVERRPATAGEPGEISEREYEFHERHEEPVVEMTTEAGEELVVRKEPSQHTERVHGKARKVEAAVENEPTKVVDPKNRSGPKKAQA